MIAGAGQACVWVCTDARSSAGEADLPYFMHLLEVTFRALKLSSVRKLTCCNAASELFACELNAGVAGACDAVLSVGCGLEWGWGCGCRSRSGLCLGVH